MDSRVRDKAAGLKLVIFDVDGVLTDGGLILGEDGREYKIFNVHDGLGLVLLREAGLEIAVISARSSPVVEQRMAALGIKYVYQGQSNKLEILQELTNRLGFSLAEVAYVGDDLVDLAAIETVGLGIAVANAQAPLQDRAEWTTSRAGGKGAVREVANMILEAQNKMDSLTDKYSVRGSGN